MGIFIIFLLRKSQGGWEKHFLLCCARQSAVQMIYVAAFLLTLKDRSGTSFQLFRLFRLSRPWKFESWKWKKACCYLTIAFSFSGVEHCQLAMCSTGLLQPRGCFLFNYNNCTFVSFASWWWSFVALALSLIWSRTQKETLWRKSGLPTSAGRFYGYVSKMGY